jgi:hypothetical protein
VNATQRYELIRPILKHEKKPKQISKEHGRRVANTCLHLVKAPHIVIRGLEVRWFRKADPFYSDDKAGIFVTDSPHVSILNCEMWNDFWIGWPIGSGIATNRSLGLVADHNVIYQVEQDINTMQRCY